MKIKQGVSLAGLQPPMRLVMKHAEYIWSVLGRECVITAGTEAAKDKIGKDMLFELIHSASSFHPFGFALDLRTNYFDSDQKAVAAARLRKALGADYDVVVHSTHIHVEYDPK